MMLRVALVSAIALFAAPALAAPENFDGEWDVSVRTSVGDCDPEMSASVTLQGGRVVGTSTPGISATGAVSAKGALSARFVQGDDTVRAQGTLKGGRGGGAWSSNTKSCGGRWTARRSD